MRMMKRKQFALVVEHATRQWAVYVMFDFNSRELQVEIIQSARELLSIPPPPPPPPRVNILLSDRLARPLSPRANQLID